jgi:LytR cell envelope-related transcriptional attenuator
VLNGGQVTGLAARISTALTGLGYRAGHVGNTAPQAATAVVYGTKVAGNAERIAATLGVTATPDATLPPAQVRVLLGTDATEVPAALSNAAPAAPSSVNGVPCVD